MGDVETDHSVKQDDLEVLGDISEGGKLTNNELFVFSKFSGSMWVCEKYSGFGGSEGNSPFTVGMNGLVHFGAVASMVDCNVDVSDCLSMMGV